MSTTPSRSLPTQYDHTAAQKRWYTFWEEEGLFHSEPNPDRKPYTIVIPPPNVTGALHLGHALNNTLQDILIRQKRMQGYETLWMPGTDHAGIATQAVVERRLLAEEKLSRHELGREGLVGRIWQWKESYEKRILGQLKLMGCSCDWERTRFTLDSVCARAVRHTFFSLFQEGLIYRGQRLVNWDTMLQTAVSDDEVFHDPVPGHFWYFHYPVIDPKPGEPKHVTIATTRPETMLGDTAVAVHPDPAAALDAVEAELREKLADAPAKQKPEIQQELDDLVERRKNLLPELITLRKMAADGRKLLLPLLEREIPLVADPWAKPEMGTGCVKITPAHDPNDYEVGLRCGLPMINILNLDGTLNDAAGPYVGQTVLVARENVVADLEKQGLVVKIEDREIDLAHSDRSKTPIEPLLTDQWFVKMDDLAQTAMDAVTDGQVKITPSRYTKGYLDWLSEKRDWPISRQLWWGHQIPVWEISFKVDTHIDDSGSHIANREKSRLVFLKDLDEFAEAFGLTDDIAVMPAGESKVVYYLCARTEQAIDEINRFYRRHHRARHSGFSDADEPVEPYLPTNDPRDTADRALWASISMMSEQEQDVLDTWFSSALWPHSTLGWPEATEELDYYYPTDVLITSRDIITLWVARMVLAGLHNVGQVPFPNVFIHPKILDGFGEGMSKSKGNGVDPIDVIEKFGADSLRFGLAYLTTETQDIRMPVEFECPHCGKLIEQTRKNRILPRVKCKECGKEFSTQWAEKPEDVALPRGAVVSDRFEQARNFCNKLWNASRFALMNLEGYTPGTVADEDLLVEDRWILSRLATVTGEVTDALDEFRYADAARALYGFAWDEFCSFYVEMVKSRLQDPADRPTAQRVLAHTLDVLLRLLHPMIPFVTEEVWQLLGEIAPERGLDELTPAASSVMIAPWPEVDAARRDPTIEARFARFQEILRGIREIRSRQNVPPKQSINFSVRCDAQTAGLLEPMAPYFASMAGATLTGTGPDVAPPALSANTALPGVEIFVDLAGLIDVAAEIAKKQAEKAKLESFIAAKEKKLSNAAFTERAPAAVVQKERDSLAELQATLAATLEVIQRLSAQK
ncbi:MAG: valine--tRNA ligase [Pirellulales bacterium]|nr:valine--tRNA ligase [Pirellulales bacterium]